MKQSLLSLCIFLLFSSCATIVNRKTTKIEVHTIPGSSTLVLSHDSAVTTPVVLEVPRSYENFEVELLHDSIRKPVLFKSRIAPQVWGNLAFLFYCPVGMIVDVYSKKKIFTYRKDILIDFTVDPPAVEEWYPDLKGKFFLTACVPGMNFLKLDTGSGSGNYSMLAGIILGGDYYYRRRSYISAEIGFTGAINANNPHYGRKVYDSTGLPAPDTVERATSFIFRITNNHDFKYASVGYGINLTDYMYSLEMTDSLGNYTTSGKNLGYLALGCNVSVRFRLFRFLTLGITYAPSFFNLSAWKAQYSHVIYLDAGIRLQMGKHRGEKVKKVAYRPRYL
jgi:hypothetical protein